MTSRLLHVFKVLVIFLMVILTVLITTINQTPTDTSNGNPPTPPTQKSSASLPLFSQDSLKKRSAGTVVMFPSSVADDHIAENLSKTFQHDRLFFSHLPANHAATVRIKAFFESVNHHSDIWIAVVRKSGKVATLSRPPEHLEAHSHNWLERLLDGQVPYTEPPKDIPFDPDT